MTRLMLATFAFPLLQLQLQCVAKRVLAARRRLEQRAMTVDEARDGLPGAIGGLGGGTATHQEANLPEVGRTFELGVYRIETDRRGVGVPAALNRPDVEAPHERRSAFDRGRANLANLEDRLRLPDGRQPRATR